MKHVFKNSLERILIESIAILETFLDTGICFDVSTTKNHSLTGRLVALFQLLILSRHHLRNCIQNQHNSSILQRIIETISKNPARIADDFQVLTILRSMVPRNARLFEESLDVAWKSQESLEETRRVAQKNPKIPSQESPNNLRKNFKISFKKKHEKISDLLKTPKYFLEGECARRNLEQEHAPYAIRWIGVAAVYQKVWKYHYLTCDPINNNDQ